MNILEFLFPKQCIVCSKVEIDMCAKCLTNIPLVLPSCCICSRLSNEYKTHEECSNRQFQCFTGWYMTKELDSLLSKKINLGIYSTHIYMLEVLINRLSRNLNIQEYKIEPLPNKDRKTYELNKVLVKSIQSKNTKSKRILFVGNTFEDIPELKGLINEPFTILTLFRKITAE